MAQPTLESDWLVSVIDAATSFSVGLSVLLLGAWPVWKATRTLARRDAIRALAVPLLAFGAFAASLRTPVPTDQGTWVCLTCGTLREELRYLDLTLLASPEQPSSCLGPPEGLRRPCVQHDWSPTGCHSYGRDLDGATSTGWCYPIN